MAITRLKLLRFMSTWPLVGAGIKLRLNKELSDKLETVSKGFNSPKIRFSENLHFLYDSLQGLDIELEENFKAMANMELVTYTKTSAMASVLLYRLSEPGGCKLEDYFKETLKELPLPFLDWYSNKLTLDAFLGGTVTLLDLYTKMYPRDNDGHAYTATELKMNTHTQEFLSGRHFKLLIVDFIQVLLLLLALERRGLYEKGK